MNPETCSSVPDYFKKFFSELARAGHPEGLPVDLDRPSVFSDEPVQPVVHDLRSIKGLVLGEHLD